MKPEDSANLQVGAWAALASRVPGARLGNAGAGGAADLERDTLDTSVHSHTHTHAHTHAHWGMRLSPQAHSHRDSHTRSQKHSQGTHWLAHSLHTHSCVPPAHCHTHTRSAGQVSYTLHTVTQMRPLRVTLIQMHTCYSHRHAHMLTAGLCTYVYYYTHAATCTLLPR